MIRSSDIAYGDVEYTGTVKRVTSNPHIIFWTGDGRFFWGVMVSPWPHHDLWSYTSTDFFLKNKKNSVPIYDSAHQRLKADGLPLYSASGNTIFTASKMVGWRRLGTLFKSTGTK